MPTLLKSRLPFLVLASVLVIAFLLLNLPSSGNTWSGGSLRYLGIYIIATSLFALVTYKVAKPYNHLILFLATILFLIFGAGVGEVFTATLFFASSYILGFTLLNILFKNGVPLSFFSSLITGFALHVLMLSIFSRWHINVKFLYLSIMCYPFILFFYKKNIIPSLNVQEKISLFLNTLCEISYFQLALFLSFFIYIASHSFFPTVMYDDNAMHLSWWTQLSFNKSYIPDVVSQIWAAEPFTVDLIHGVLSVVAGADSKSALNMYLLIFTSVSVFSLSKLFIDNINDRLLVVALFLSTPMICNLLLGLQTDLFLSFLASIGCVLLYELKAAFSPRQLVGVLLIIALCASTKVPGILLGLGFFASIVVMFFQVKYDLKTITFRDGIVISLFVCIMGAVALYPYINAYLVTGNPVFPLYNGIFKSAYFEPNNFIDNRFVKGANLKSFYGLFFDTSNYFESKNNAAGFQFFLLFPLSLLMLVAFRKKESIYLLIPLLVYLLPMYFTMQYLRYFFAVVPIISVLLAVLLSADVKQGGSNLLSRASFVFLIGLNFAFLSGVSYLFHTSPLAVYSAEGKQQFASEVAPEIQLNAQINTLNKNAKVLFDFNRPYGATLAGTPFYNSWYSPKNYASINKWESTKDVAQTFKDWNLDYVYWNMAQPYTKTTVQKNILREYLLDYGYPQMQVGSILAYKIGDIKSTYQNVFTRTEFNNLDGFEVTGTPVIQNKSVIVGSSNIITSTFDVASFSAFKYQVSITCENDTDEFIAQINWDLGNSYYKVVNCSGGEQFFAETGLIPKSASKAILYLSSRANSNIVVNSVSVGAR